MKQKMRNFCYYRAGVLLARFRIGEDAVWVIPRDRKTMAFGEERSFSLPMEPFDSMMDGGRFCSRVVLPVLPE